MRRTTRAVGGLVLLRSGLLARAGLATAAVLATVAFGGPAGAQPFPETDLPPALRPWVPWVRSEVPDAACPAVNGQAVCAWPGRLELRLGAAGGTFGLDVHADRLVDLPLPGDPQRWPMDVRLDGTPAVVRGVEGAPAVRLTPGRHRLVGRFAWPRLPDSLPVPKRLGLVDLAVDGRPVADPRRDESGLLWLRSEGQVAGSAESLRLQVFRKVRDGIPVQIETRLALEVSGKAREVELQGSLLPGSVPLAVGGALPARLDAAGRLRVQVRAGAYVVLVTARLEKDAASLSPPPAVDPWPASEVWVFEADEALRQVELSGPNPVDPSRTELPAEWRSLPAFAMDKDQALALQAVRRGEPEPPPDKLALQRQIWLDLSGGGYTVRDTFTGTLARTWRLDLRPPGSLGRVSLGGEEQLVTANPSTQAPGVEVRRSALALEADSRVPRSGRLPAVGWSADVERLGAQLNLPPGWWLLGASGVDAVPGAWTARWTLLGFFFVLIVALSTAKLFGPRWGALALAAMVLTYAERGAPYMVWLSLLGATALALVAPAGKLRTLAGLWRAVSLIALVLILLPFVRDQVREALYPQVAGDRGAAAGEGVLAPTRHRGPAGMVNVEAPMDQPMAPPPPPPAPQAEQPMAANEELEADQVQERDLEGGVVGGSVGGVPPATLTSEVAQRSPLRERTYGYSSVPSKSNVVALKQDPRAVLQTGPGVPTWRWRSYALTWSGPVKADQSVRLFLVSPGLHRLLTFLRLVVVLLLAVRLWAGRAPSAPSPAPAPSSPPPPAPPNVTAALLVGVLSASASVGFVPRAQAAEASAAIPDRATLDELRNRLLRPEPCQPRCLTTASLHLRLSEGGLSFAAEVHAADRGAWAVPGPPSAWAPAQVRVDGQPAAAVARLEDGFLYVRLSAGVHRVEAIGPAPRADSLTVQLRDRPMRADADAAGWEVAGLRADGPPETSIQLNRRLRAGERAREDGGRYAPWLEVTRTLRMGLTWSVDTTVSRVSPPGTPVSARVPLLPGEAPTTPDLQTENGVAVVSLGRDEAATSWSSTLPITDVLTLRAPDGQPWSEVWRLECGIVWQCDADGIPPVSHQDGGVLAPTYRPWPGESVALAFRHPNAVAGQTLTLDGVRLTNTPGDRLGSTVLQLTARASREESLVLGLPADAELQELKVDDVARPGKPDAQGKLRVTVPAGRHQVSLSWRQPRGMGLVHRVPVVGLPISAVNVETYLRLPDNRWLLLTRGPAWGPAILFWGYLVLALVIALALSVGTDTPLRPLDWVLFTLGLSQLAAPAALIVVGLFVALSWRRRRPPASPFLHDLLQLVLAVWIVVALLLIYDVVRTGLLLRPDMQVAGADSSNTTLHWYADRVEGATPAAAVWSLPLWVYRGLMLGWALWLAARLLRWSVWAWQALGTGGFWRRLRLPGPKGKGTAVPPPPPPPAAPPSPPAA